MEKGKTDYELLYSEENLDLEQLIKIYKDNPYHARIVYMNNSTHYKFKRLVLFKGDDGVSICLFEKKYGISITNRIYSHEKCLGRLNFKGGKFTMSRYGKAYTATLNSIHSIFRCVGDDIKEVFDDTIIKQHPWMQYLLEDNFLLTRVSLNTILTKKIFSKSKALKLEYGLPLPIAKAIHTSTSKRVVNTGPYYKHYLKYMDNVETLQRNRLYDNDYFYDTIKMGKILNRKVNCSWSPKRLKSVHDDWAEEITILVSTLNNRNMRISQHFIDFSYYSGYEILRTTKEMAEEGLKQKHCVGTYISKVENGNSGIYHIDGYTLELCKNRQKQPLYIGQFRGFENEQAPEDLVNKVQMVLDEYNNYKRYDEPMTAEPKEIHNFDLPF